MNIRGSIFGGRFANARLFAGLAVLTLGCVLATPSPAIVVYQPLTTSFFPRPRQLQLFIAAMSAFSALTYYGLARCSQSLNKFLVLAHFVLFATAALVTTIAVMAFASILSQGNYQNTTLYIVGHQSLLAIAWPSFALGCIAYVANLCIAAVKLLSQTPQR